MDIKEVFEAIQKKHFTTIVYSILCFFSFLFGFFTVVAIVGSAISGYMMKNIPLILFNAGLFFTLLVGFLILRRTHIVQTQEEAEVEPYVIPLAYGGTNYIQHLKSKLSMEELPDGNYYSLIPGARDILVLLFHVDCFDEKQFKEIRKKDTKAARKNMGWKTERSIAETKNSNRVNILLIDDITDELTEEIRTNAVYGTKYAEAVIDMYVDLTNKKLYIPAYESLWYGGSAKYTYCVNQLLDIICVK